MKYFIRNIQLKKLILDGRRVPLNFDSKKEAYNWMRRNGYPDFLQIVSTLENFTDYEKKQLLKVNFQEVS